MGKIKRCLAAVVIVGASLSLIGAGSAVAAPSSSATDRADVAAVRCPISNRQSYVCYQLAPGVYFATGRRSPSTQLIAGALWHRQTGGSAWVGRYGTGAVVYCDGNRYEVNVLVVSLVNVTRPLPRNC